MTTDGFDYASATVPKGALFVAADEPLLIYPSVAAAEQDLEAIDVENGVYPAAYGPNGEPYHIGNDGDCVIIERTGEPNRPDELKTLLLRYFEASDRLVDATAPVDHLVAEAWQIESDFWREHDPYAERFGTRIPWWGCLGFVVALAAGFLVLFG